MSDLIMMYDYLITESVMNSFSEYYGDEDEVALSYSRQCKTLANAYLREIEAMM